MAGLATTFVGSESLLFVVFGSEVIIVNETLLHR